MSTLPNVIASVLGCGKGVIELPGTYDTSSAHGPVRYRWNLDLDRGEFLNPRTDEWRASTITNRSYFASGVLLAGYWPDVTRLRQDLHALVLEGKI